MLFLLEVSFNSKIIFLVLIGNVEKNNGLIIMLPKHHNNTTTE